MRQINIRWLLPVMLSLAALNALGAQGLSAPVTVISILQDSTNYGGCMARIRPGPANIQTSGGALLNCPGDVFVSFDCLNTTGQTNKSVANAMLNTAQLAYVTGDKVNVLVTDSVKINGFCVARRIDLRPR